MVYRSSYDYCVKGGVLGPAKVAVGMFDMGVFVSEVLEELL